MNPSVSVRCLSFFLALVAIPSAGWAQDLRNNAFFKALEGTWVGQGEVEDNKGVINAASNTIAASFSSDGSMFTIKGKMLVDTHEMEYRWEYTKHSIEGMYSGKFINSDGQETLFDAAIDEANLTARVSQTSGVSGDPRIELEKKIADGKYHATFSIIDTDGSTTFSGKLIFDKE